MVLRRASNVIFHARLRRQYPRENKLLFNIEHRQRVSSFISFRSFVMKLPLLAAPPTIILLPLLLAPVVLTQSFRLSPAPTTFLSSTSTTTTTKTSSLGKMMASPTTTAAAAAATATAVTGKVPKIAVIGGGAAGLAAARVLSRAGWNPVVLEKGNTIGGVWNYQPKKNPMDDMDSQKDQQQQKSNGKSNVSPMYRGLRTNLPKEIMAFREFPWPDDLDLGSHDEDTLEDVPTVTDRSFVTHAQVQQYLQAYAAKFDLKQYIRTECQVEQLTVLLDPQASDADEQDQKSSSLPGTSSDGTSTSEKWPRIQLDWRCCSKNNDPSSSDNSATTDALHSEVFDAVCVCNGHYSAPAFPDLPGLGRGEDYFQGRTLHSVHYDDPEDFKGQTVLCIGGRASGADLAREIAPHATHVYLSDTMPPVVAGDDDGGGGGNYNRDERNDDGTMTKYDVTWVPKTVGILPDGSIQLDTVNGSKQVAPLTGVDVIIFCTGYDYSFPFCNDHSNLEFAAVSGSRRVTPLYEQLWHAVHPNIALVGLPHSNVPFPSFELQCEAVLGTWQGGTDSERSRTLPDLKTRLQQAEQDAVSGGEGRAPGTGRVPQDTHYLGSAQWEYCQRMAEYAGLHNDGMRDYLATNQVCGCVLLLLLFWMVVCTCGWLLCMCTVTRSADC
jgi:cation diffusion facilitator CzcD-associated flavoprotein CzcO